MTQSLKRVPRNLRDHAMFPRWREHRAYSRPAPIACRRDFDGAVRTFTTWLLVLCVIALLAGCGFHLRGGAAYAMPFKSAYIQGGDNDNLMLTRLQDALTRAGISLENTPESAQVVIELGNVRNESRVLTVGSSGDIEEYELYYGVNLAFRRGTGELLQAGSPVEFTTEYTYDTTSVLAKEEERETLVGDMRAAAVREILRRAGRLPLTE